MIYEGCELVTENLKREISYISFALREKETGQKCIWNKWINKNMRIPEYEGPDIKKR